MKITRSPNSPPQFSIITFLFLLGIGLVSSSCSLSSDTNSKPPDTQFAVDLETVQNPPVTEQPELLSSPSITQVPISTEVIIQTTSSVENTPNPANILETQEAFENAPPLEIPPGLEFPPPVIKIYNPGDMSRVVSPFTIVSEIPNSPDDLLILELFGEDGRLLNSETIEDLGPAGYIDSTNINEIQFEIQAVAEFGKLRISLIDKFGRHKAINTVNLILLKEGSNEIMGYGDLQDNLFLQNPISNLVVSGESVFVSGYIRDRYTDTLSITLQNENLQILGESEAMILDIIDSDYSLFLGSVDFTITTPLEVRLIVEAKDPNSIGSIYLNSVLIILEP